MSILPRVEHPDDPRRCHGNTGGGQCWHLAAEGAEYCDACARQDLVLANRRSYQLTNPKYHARFIELSEDEDIKSLREEMALIRVLIEERFNQIQGGVDIAQHSGAISSLVLTLERLRTRSHIIEQNLGQLLHKTAVAQLVREFITVVNEEVRELPGGVAAIDRIVERCKESAMKARNKEQARGLKLLEQDT